MERMRKAVAFLMMAVFLVALMPFQGVRAADGGGMDVMPDAEYTVWTEGDTVKTKVEMANGEEWGMADIYQLNLEFENENGSKIVVSQNLDKGIASGQRTVATFLEGGTYKLVRVFGRLLPSAEYSFTAESLGLDKSFTVEKEVGETLVEFSTRDIKEDERFRVKIKLPFEPYNISEIKGTWKFLDKQVGDADYYAIAFMNNWGIKYNEATGFYECELWISDRPSGRYELDSLEVVSGVTGEKTQIYRGQAGVTFNADYTYTRRVEPKIDIVGDTGEVSRGESVRISITAGEELNEADTAILTYNAVNSIYYSTTGGFTEYTLKRGEDDKFKSDLYISPYMIGGEHELYSIKFIGEDFEAVVAKDRVDLTKGNLNVEGDLDLNWVDLDAITDKTEYAMGARIKFIIEHNLVDLEYVDVCGTIKLKNLDGESERENAFAMYHWNEESKELVVEELYSGRDLGGNFGDTLYPGRYVIEGYSVGPKWDWNMENPDKLVDSDKVLFNIVNPMNLTPEQLADKEDALDYANYILDLIDSVNPVEGKEIAEKYMDTIMPIVIESKAVEADVPANKPKYVFNSENLRALHIEEALDANVGEVNVRLDAEVIPSEEMAKYNKTLGEEKNIIGLYNLSLMKVITMNTSEVHTSKIENEHIKSMLTLRLPVPEEYKESENLKVVYINDLGVIEELETVLVEEGGIKYLEFQTDHFSLYGVMEVSEEVVVEEPVEEEPVDEEPVEEEPVEEEPVTEEPVTEEPIEVEVGEEVEFEVEKPAEKDKEAEKETAKDDKLPEAGVGSTLGYSLSGILFSGAGLVMLRKKEDKE